MPREPRPSAKTGRRGGALQVGATLADLEISRAWLVDPFAGREGAGEIVVRDGEIAGVTWLTGAAAKGVDASGVIVAPGFLDLHVHLREPGFEDAETVATGLAAAAHGGFTRVCAMANTSPAIDGAAVVGLVRAAAAASGSPVALEIVGAVSAGRAGEKLAALGEMTDAGVVGFSDDGAPVKGPVLLAHALRYAGMLGRPIVEHAEDTALTSGAEANEGLVASVLGLRGWPAAAEEAVVARDLAILADVVRDVPGARLHLTHLSTAGALDLVRRAKAAGLPVTCDVTPHHLALADEWIAGARRWAWEAVDGAGARRDPVGAGAPVARDPWTDAAIVAEPFDPDLRVNPPLRDPADAAAVRAALRDGTADAVATDHAPHTLVDKEVEFGLAANGISGIETALGVLLAAVDAGELTLAAAMAALTSGPAGVLGAWTGRPVAAGLKVGAPADLVLFDRGESWTVTPASLRSKGKNTPLAGRALPGRVLLTVAAGRIAFSDLD
ncbi:MAG: dihydroorotase [Chloroflexi bacterium]|jgi:dihydroorotase|nr:dihydroorotase [Chloroflexota bacterium]